MQAFVIVCVYVYGCVYGIRIFFLLSFLAEVMEGDEASVLGNTAMEPLRRRNTPEV